MSDQPQQPASRLHVGSVLGLIVFTLVIATLLIKGLLLDPTRAPSALVGKVAKDFSLTPFQAAADLGLKPGESFSLRGLGPRPVLVNFWASWCQSCREEARVLEAFWEKHKAEGLVVIGIAVQDKEEAAAEFAREFGKTYPLALDKSGAVGIDYGVTGVPETFFIDHYGTIRDKVAAPVTPKDLEDKMLPLVAAWRADPTAPHDPLRKD